MKNIIRVGLSILMILSLAVPAGATDIALEAKTEGLIAPQYTHIMFMNSKLTISSLGEATCIGVSALYNGSHTVELIVELQRQNGSVWTPIKTWTTSGPGVPGVEIERSHYVVRGTYRVCTTAKVRDAAGNLLENVSVYSVVVMY